MQHFSGGLCVAPPGGHAHGTFLDIVLLRSECPQHHYKNEKNKTNNKEQQEHQQRQEQQRNTTESKAPHSKANVCIFFRLVMHHRSNDVANMLRTINHYNVTVDLRGVSVAIVKSCYGTHVLIEQFNSWNMPCLACPD